MAPRSIGRHRPVGAQAVLVDEPTNASRSLELRTLYRRLGRLPPRSLLLLDCTPLAKGSTLAAGEVLKPDVLTRAAAPAREFATAKMVFSLTFAS